MVRWWFPGTLLCSLLMTAHAVANPFDEALAADLSAGMLDVDRADVYRLAATIRPELLPADLRYLAEIAEPLAGWTCGTPAVLPVLRRYDAMDPDLQQLVRAVMAPEGQGMELDVDDEGRGPGSGCNNSAPNEQESDHFVVKWGSNYAGAGVDDLLEVLETARTVFVDDYGHQEPYGVIEGGWKLPIFIGNSGSGLPTISWSGGYTTVCTDHPGAYIVLSQDLESWEFTADVAPHELYHAVQFGYGIWLDDWWWEATAVWSEDLAYPDVNGYVWFLSEYTSEPHVSMEDTGGIRMYGMFIWPMYIEEFELDGADALREVWEEATSESIPVALGAILEDKHENTYDGAFASFTARAGVMSPFEDGHLFSEPIRVATVNSFPDDSDDAADQPPERYGTNYIEIDTSDADEPNTKLRFEFDGGGDTTWTIGATRHRIEDEYDREIEDIEVLDDGTAVFETIDQGSLYDEVVIGITWTGQSNTSTPYTWTVDLVEQTEPQGDDDVVPDDDDDDVEYTGCFAASPYQFDPQYEAPESACQISGMRGSARGLVPMLALVAGIVVRRRRGR
jgi:hypothetical protein